MSAETMTTAELREWVSYDPKTGVFRRVKPSGGVRAGAVIGTREHKGHMVATFGGQRYKLHRLAWLYVYGEWPKGLVDHKDRDASNNRIKNLRLSTNIQNCANRRMSKRNTTGFRGVVLRKTTGRYEASIGHGMTKKFLGVFETAEAASRAYQRAAKALKGEFAGVFSHG